MTDQQTHLKNVLEQQNALLNEIQKLNNELGAKREMALKLQGIIEYLTATGVKLPEAPAEESNSDTEVVKDPFKENS
jgi:hypothetical protein